MISYTLLHIRQIIIISIIMIMIMIMIMIIIIVIPGYMLNCNR